MLGNVIKKKDVKRAGDESQSLILNRLKYCIGSESLPPHKLLLFDQRTKKSILHTAALLDLSLPPPGHSLCCSVDPVCFTSSRNFKTFPFKEQSSTRVLT